MAMGHTLSQWFSNDCQKVVDGLWIGHVGCAQDALMLMGKRITHVVDVSARGYVPPPGVTLLRLPVPDEPDYDIRQIFGRTNAFIRNAIKTGHNVLVHCAWGISRSASVVLAYLMAFHNLSLNDSLAHLRTCRPVVNPNSGFMHVLSLYEAELAAHRARQPRPPSLV